MIHDHYDPEVPYLPHTNPWHDQSGYHFQPPPTLHNYAYAFEQSPYTGPPGHPLPRSSHQHLSPLVVTPWPSTYTNPGPYTAPVPSLSQPMPFAPVSAPPTIAPPLTHEQRVPRHAATPRKTLTDTDRRRMCEYSKDNPTKKQVEIGDVFGVERSTVSKVLNKKEIYLQTDERCKSPARRKTSNNSNWERALENWVMNEKERGIRHSDDSIVKQAGVFATSSGSDDHPLDRPNRHWLEKLKQKVFGPQSRKGCMFTLSPSMLQPMSIHLDNASPAPFLSRVGSPDDSPNATGQGAFTDSAPPLFSASSAHENSPIFYSTPEHAHDASTNAHLPSQPSTQAESTSQRARSQTFPLAGTKSYLSPPPPNRAITPKVATINEDVVLECPRSEILPHTISTNGTITNALGIDYRTPNDSAIPSSVNDVPVHPMINTSKSHESSPPASYQASISVTQVTPSNEEALRALEILLYYVQNHPDGHVKPHELKTIQSCMDKLKITGKADQAVDFKWPIAERVTLSPKLARRRDIDIST